MRRIERWLHQHVFKVGWLSTHNYQTTTILYYTFFLPGIILHELVYYLAAGIFNVRAERQIKWPDEQEIGELKLNFVKLAPRTSAFRKAVITSLPLLVGLICIWAISNYIFDITAVVDRMSSGDLDDVLAAFDLLLGAPLFWLWIYVIFTIANTMFPTVPKDLRGWRSVLIGLAVVAVALLLVGIGGTLFEVLQSPLNTIILVLTQTFVLLICIDLAMVLILGLIEYTIERVTGHSATFRGNRMYTMTREEAQEEREREREKARKKAAREQRRREKVQAGPVSIYALAFTIPDAPSKETIIPLNPVTETATVTVEEDVEEKAAISMPTFGGLAEDSKAVKTVSEEEKARREAIAARINLPPRRSPVPASSDDEIDEKVSESPSSRPSPITIDEGDSQDKPAASVSSRFGIKPVEKASDKDVSADKAKPAAISSRFGQATDDKAKDKTAASLGSRLSRTTTDKESEKAESTGSSRFGNKPLGKTGAKDEARDKPAASLGSRFGQSIKTEEKDEQSAVSRLGTTSSGDNEKVGKEKPAASIGSRFGQKARGLESEKQTVPAPDDDETVRVVGRPVSPSLIDEDEDDEALDESIARRGRGDGSISNLFGQLDDDEDDSSRSSKSGFASRFGGLSKSDDDAITNDRESIDSFFDAPTPSPSRSEQSTSPISPSPLDSGDGKNDGGLGQFSKRSSASSRFGSPLSPTPSSSDDEDDKDESISSKLGNYRRSSPLSTRFGSSRPAPKPSASRESDNVEERSDEDGVVYEDIDDDYVYEDDEEYIDFDDEEFYDDDED